MVDGDDDARAEAKRVSRELWDAARALDERGQHADALAAYEAVVAFDRARPLPKKHKKIVKRLRRIGRARAQVARQLRALGRVDEALAIYDELIVDEDAGHLAFALRARVATLADLGRAPEQLVAEIDAALARLDGRTGATNRTAIAQLSYNKSVLLERLGRDAEAAAVRAELVARFSASIVPEIASAVALARGDESDHADLL